MSVQCNGCGQVWSSADNYAGIEEHRWCCNSDVFLFFILVAFAALCLWQSL